MHTAIEVITWAELGVYSVLALAALNLWRRRRGRHTLWAALAFGTLAAVLTVSRLVPEDTSGGAAEWEQKALVAVLLLFPYLLYRFAASFEARPHDWFGWLALAVTSAVLIWTFALTEIPAPDEETPETWPAYLIAIVVQWVLILVYVIARLWRAGRGQPRVARYRMRLLSLAAGGLTLTLVLAATSPEEDSVLDLGVAVLALASGVAFFLGLSPPQILRVLWRRPEEDRLREVVADLMAASTEDEVKERVLPHMAAIVGARAVTLVDLDWAVIASYGVNGDDVAEPVTSEEDSVRLDLPAGSILVRASRYAPFFGGDELDRLRALGSLTLLALDRARLFAQEREARLALERASELQNRFIALASHELRTPAATIYGTAATLHIRGDALAGEQQRALHAVLFDQTERLRALVEQLLDLSRLEAEAIEIRPQPLPVRRRIEELVRDTAGDRADEIAIDVPTDLVAYVDVAAFDRVCSNLVTNALRYGEPPIRVAAGQSDRHFRLAVEDAGPGVTGEFVPHLFEPCSRSEYARGTDSVGTGLGLAIARSYAHAHGGDLLYEPARPRGARFVLVVPSAPDGLTETAEP